MSAYERHLTARQESRDARIEAEQEAERAALDAILRDLSRTRAPSSPRS